MLSDGAHECLGLVRYFDTDSYDIAAAPARIECLLGRLSFLFLEQRGCLDSVSFTKACHSDVSEDYVFKPSSYLNFITCCCFYRPGSDGNTSQACHDNLG